MRFLIPIAAIAIVSLSVETQAQTSDPTAGASAGLATGAVTGAIVGGPVGAVVGGVIGAIAGGALAPPQVTQVQQYVVSQGTPSVRVQGPVAVGQPLSSQVQTYAIPSSTGVETTNRYTVVDERTVLVDPRSGRIVQVLR